MPPREDTGYQSEDSFVAETLAIRDEESEADVEGTTQAPVIPELGRKTFEVRSPPSVPPKAIPPHVKPKLFQTTPKLLPTPKNSPSPSQPGSSSSSIRVVPTAASTARASGSGGVPEPVNPPPLVRVDPERVKSLGFRISRLPEFKHSERLTFSVVWHHCWGSWQLRLRLLLIILVVLMMMLLAVE